MSVTAEITPTPHTCERCSRFVVDGITLPCCTRLVCPKGLDFLFLIIDADPDNLQPDAHCYDCTVQLVSLVRLAVRALCVGQGDADSESDSDGDTLSDSDSECASVDLSTIFLVWLQKADILHEHFYQMFKWPESCHTSSSDSDDEPLH